MNFDAVTIGDYAMDIVLQLGDSKAKVIDGQGKGEIALPRDEKVLVDELDYSVGGNACNVSVGLSRLGLNISFLTYYGQEWWRNVFLEEMQKEKVDLSLALKINQPASNYSTSIFFRNEKTLLIHNNGHKYNLLSDLPSSKILFLSSVGPAFESFFEEISDFVYRTKTTLAFNPASHQFEKNLNSYKNILAVCDFLFLNKKEAQKVLSAQEENIGELVKMLSALGPKNIIVTDQANGAYLYSEERLFFCPIFPRAVKQKTGAGDAFTSGFLAGYFHGHTLPDCLKWGTFNSAEVISQAGPHQGLLLKEQMDKLLSENETPKVETIFV